MTRNVEKDRIRGLAQHLVFLPASPPATSFLHLTSLSFNCVCNMCRYIRAPHSSPTIPSFTSSQIEQVITRFGKDTTQSLHSKFQAEKVRSRDSSSARRVYQLQYIY